MKYKNILAALAVIMLVSCQNNKATTQALEYIPEQIEIISEAENLVSFDDLIIQLPKGWIFENQVDEFGEIKSYLVDNHEHYSDYYEHKILLRHYKIPDELTETALLYELSKLADSDDIRSCDYKREGDYCILNASDTAAMQTKWFIKNGQEVYATEEFELTLYSEEEEEFYDFLENKRIYMENLENPVNTPEEFGSHTMFYKIWKVNDEASFFVTLNKNVETSTVTIYKPGEWDIPVTQLESIERTPYIWKLSDLNYDGNIDLDLSTINEKSGYIWDEENSKFTYYAAQVEENNRQNTFCVKKEGIKDYHKTQNEIPASLLEKIKEAMINGTEYQTLKAMVNDRELSPDEVHKIKENNPDLARVINIFASTLEGNGLFIMADGDNDGIDDIILQAYQGGSGGFTTFYFFKGAGNGYYKCTDTFEAVRQEFTVIEYEEKNYLCCTEFDYGKKMYNGFSIYFYKNGELKEEAWLQKRLKSYISEIQFIESDRYNSLVSKIQADCIKDSESNAEEGQALFIGSAETEIKEEKETYFKSDINNDGVMETYEKGVWLSSTMYTVDCLSFSILSEGTIDFSTLFSEIGQKEKGIIVMLWIDQINNENIVNIKFREGLYDYSVYSYLFSGDSYKKVCQIKFTAVEWIRCNIK